MFGEVRGDLPQAGDTALIDLHREGREKFLGSHRRHLPFKSGHMGIRDDMIIIERKRLVRISFDIPGNEKESITAYCQQALSCVLTSAN